MWTTESEELQRALEEWKRSEEKRRRAERLYQKLIDTTSEGFWLIDTEYRTVDCNESFCRMLGYTREELIGKTPYDLANEHNKEVFTASLSRIETVDQRSYEVDFQRKTGEPFPVHINATTLRDESGEVLGSFALITDISDRKKAEAEQQRLFRELQEALAQVKKLSGFLPICASCKKIRDDEGYWNEVEHYLQDHSEAVLSHSLCPDCAQEFMNEAKR